MGASWKWVVLWSLWAARLVRQPTLPLRVSGGLLRGSVAHDGSHRNYLAIPYATVNWENRFQAPQPARRWDDVLEAYNENIRCSQRYALGMIAGTENCLTLNVYTPLHDSTEPRPVMVFIHGGGFREGSGSRFLYGPEYLVKYDIVLVTFNYRLEILGFLCLGTEVAPGNAGMKDQVEALKWVRKNIRAFGGDPDNVTIFGESAGSASVLFHMVSPMSKGLFKRAILQSGSIAPWSFQYEPLKAASALAKQMGYNTQDPKELHKIFMTKTAEELLTTRVPRAKGDIILSENIFVPCIEKKQSGIKHFIEENPYNLLVKGQYSKVPVIIGYNNIEGLMFISKENDTTLANMNTYHALPRDLLFPSDADKIEVAEKLQQFYMGEEKVSKETRLKFSRFVGDSCITYPVIATIDALLKTSKEAIYGYKLSYDGWMNLAKFYYFGFGKMPGATHADDLFYIFKPTITLVQSFFETKMVDKITTFWTNFAKTGNPTSDLTSVLPIKWQKLDKKDPKLLVIDKEFSTEPIWKEEPILFWDTTYAKFRRKS